MADDKTAAEPKPWRCKTCGSTRPVAARAGREMDGFPLMAQCVEHGHWNKPPKEWGDAPSLESPLAAVRRVTPDREKVAAWLFERTMRDRGSSVTWAELTIDGQREQWLGEADDLLSGVLGVPADQRTDADADEYRAGNDVRVRQLFAADQRTADRETIAEQILRNTAPGGGPVTEFNRYDDTTVDYIKSEARRDEHHEWTRCLALADAVLAVLVPADQVRAEAWDEGWKQGSPMGDSPRVENPYRKGAGA